MKKMCFFIFSFVAFGLYAQTSSDVLKIHDTQNVNDATNSLSKSFRLDFKKRATIGVPGTGNYSSNLTIAPWNDSSGGLVHQLNLNDGGIFYRTGAFGSSSWNAWQRILLESSGGKVGIGTNDPQANLDIFDKTANANKAILARLQEGGTTYLGIKAYDTQPVHCKSFAIEHYFYGKKNSSINFYRGGDQIGGFVTIDVYSGTPMAKFSNQGLDVNGIVRAKEVRVESTGWADYVFRDGYQLPSLTEVKAHIDENKHLPGIPTEAEVKENGVDLGKMQVKLLQKIEELTLYVIQLQETVDKQNVKIEKLENEKK